MLPHCTIQRQPLAVGPLLRRMVPAKNALGISYSTTFREHRSHSNSKRRMCLCDKRENDPPMSKESVSQGALSRFLWENPQTLKGYPRPIWRKDATRSSLGAPTTNRNRPIEIENGKGKNLAIAPQIELHSPAWPLIPILGSFSKSLRP